MVNGIGRDSAGIATAEFLKFSVFIIAMRQILQGN